MFIENMGTQIKLSSTEKERAKTLHKESIIIDLHCHGRVARKKANWVKNIPMLKKGGVTTVFNNLFYEEFTWGSVDEFVSSIYNFNGIAMMALKDIEDIYSDILHSQGQISLALKAEDIREAKKIDKIAMVLALEGAKPLEGKLFLLDIFKKLGVRLIQFNHNWRNQLSDGVVERNPAGLSNFGVEVVNRMNKLGMLIGVTHTAEPGFFDIIETSKDPIVASHVGSRKFRNVKQNLTDEMILALAENGGIIGTHFGSGIIKETLGATVDDILDHIDYFVDLAGIDHVGIGPDFIPGGMLSEDPKQKEQMLRYFKKIRPAFFTRETPNPPTLGFERMWEGLPNFTKGLVARGYSNQEIRKILGENALRVLEKVVG
jgi:membrane dipeptidase